jgi:hypothetical protein
MRFSVSVPVLSLQMAVAPPMVSQAASTLWTRTGVIKKWEQWRTEQVELLEEHCLLWFYCKLFTLAVHTLLAGWINIWAS